MKILGWAFLSPFAFEFGHCVSVRAGSSNSEVIEPYTNRNLAAPSRSLRSIRVPDITPADWMTYEEGIVKSASSRFLTSDSITSAADFIESNLRVLGYDVEFDAFEPPIPGKPAKNIIGRRVGATSETVLIGAHYDDLPSSGPAPGADDNASGVATLLSVARALSSLRPKRNIVFVAFSGEEQGMVGSAHFARSVAPGMNIVASIILDQDGNPGTSRSLILESVGETEDNLRLMDTIADSMDKNLGTPVVNFKGFGSDHVSMSSAGIPAVLAIERDNMKFAKEYGHTSRDDLSVIDDTFGSAIANTILQAVVRLAMA